MKTATKKAPAPGELRVLLESMAIEKIRLDQRIEDLTEVAQTHAKRRDEMHATLIVSQKVEKDLKDTIGRLHNDVEDLRAQLESSRTLNIGLRAQNEVSRARGYIAGLQGEPFEGPLVTRERSISCDTADVAGAPMTAMERSVWDEDGERVFRGRGGPGRSRPGVM